MIDRIEALLASGRQAAVAFIDLDDFKAVNDGFGHHEGDRMLAAVAHRLEQLAPWSVLVGRAGGDEFIAVAARVADIEALVDDVVLTSSTPGGLVPDTPHVVRASLGLAVSRPDESCAALLARGDVRVEGETTARPASVTVPQRAPDGAVRRPLRKTLLRRGAARRGGRGRP